MWPLAGADARAWVFILTRTDCPISNRDAPELQRLHQRFAPGGVVFRLVYPDPAEDAEGIRRHVEDFGYPFDALRDPKHRLVHLAQATVTPEVVVFAGGRGPRLVYRGRIDDRYVAFGKARAAPEDPRPRAGPGSDRGRRDPEAQDDPRHRLLHPPERNDARATRAALRAGDLRGRGVRTRVSAPASRSGGRGAGRARHLQPRTSLRSSSTSCGHLPSSGGPGRSTWWPTPTCDAGRSTSFR